MRYYHVIFNTSSEEIKEKAKVKFSSYYDNTFAEVNDYLYRNLKNGLNFSSTEKKIILSMQY